VSRHRATGLAAALGAVVLAAAGSAQATPPPVGAAALTPEQVAAAVRTLDVTVAVRSIDPADWVRSLRTEEHRGTETLVTINTDVLFGFDSAALTDVARREVTALAGRIRTATGAVRVDGYTDNVGTPAYNLILSQRRATAVADALRPSAAAGVLVSATGHGAANPVAPNTKPDGSDDPDGRARNRRVTITFP
jgi:outer membrane protein OmpA-like peptidoglycan-associated protein